MSLRFNQTATSHGEARQYYVNRAISLLDDLWMLEKMEDVEWGVIAYFYNTRLGGRARSAYVFPHWVGQGCYTNWLNSFDGKVLSLPDCERTWAYLEKHCLDRMVNARVVRHRKCSLPYKYVSEFYGDRRSKRSGQYYMNHIDEGLFILSQFDDPRLQGAFCLHPIVQNDDDLFKNSEEMRLGHLLRGCEPYDIVCAMEYRRVANSYLSTHERKKAKDIDLGPMLEMRGMLIADKIQNRKDFEVYLKGNVWNSQDLDYYFKVWLERLGVSEERYIDIANLIQERTLRDWTKIGR